jgi:CheY-like chemotaxis protein
MADGLRNSNFEVLKQRLFTSPRDEAPKVQKLTRVGEVLIVDDEERFLLSIADGLSVYKKYFNLLTALNGAEAVKILKSSPAIDLVITDLSMPKMDGFELLAYMNRNYPKIPVILMTAFGTPKIEEIVHNMGIFRYLEKPLDINSIADNIFDALGIKTSKIESKTAIPGQKQLPETKSKSLATFGERTSISPDDIEKTDVKNKIETENKSKSLATFGSRTSLSIDDLKKMREEAQIKAEAKTKSSAGKKSSADAEMKALEDAEKRAILEIKAKAEAERFAREEAQREAKKAEERARQEELAREDAEMRAKAATKAKAEAEESARQEELAREEAEMKAKTAAITKAEAQKRARQEELAREEAEMKAKAEAKAKVQDEDKTQKDLKTKTETEQKTKDAGPSESTKQKLSAWKK